MRPGKEQDIDKIIAHVPLVRQGEYRLMLAISASLLGTTPGKDPVPHRMLSLTMARVERFRSVIRLICRLRRCPHAREVWRNDTTRLCEGETVEDLEYQTMLLFLRMLDLFKGFNFDDPDKPFFIRLRLPKMVLREFELPLNYTPEMADVLAQYPMSVQKMSGVYSADILETAEKASSFSHKPAKLPENQAATYISKLSKDNGLPMWCRSGQHGISKLRSEWIEKCFFLTCQTANKHDFECLRQVFGSGNVDIMCRNYQDALKHPQFYCRTKLNLFEVPWLQYFMRTASSDSIHAHSSISEVHVSANRSKDMHIARHFDSAPPVSEHCDSDPSVMQRSDRIITVLGHPDSVPPSLRHSDSNSPVVRRSDRILSDKMNEVVVKEEEPNIFYEFTRPAH